MVVSHDAALLGQFDDFFVIEESGCHHFSGSFADLQASLGERADRSERAYARRLQQLVEQESRHHRVQQRRRRKKAVGRLHELDRCQSRSRLNRRKGAAQVSQARVHGISDARITDQRRFAVAARRALQVSLPLRVAVPAPAPNDGPVVSLDGVSVSRGDRPILSGWTRRLARDRVAVVGPNGLGKTSVLQVLLRQLPPSAGVVRTRLQRVGAIAQGAADWAGPESLPKRLAAHSDAAGLQAIAERLVAHRFPLALASRSRSSLSADTMGHPWRVLNACTDLDVRCRARCLHE